MDLEDFIPVYPDQDDPNIQSIITHKQEFAELAGSIREPPPKRGESYNHQKLFRRAFMEWDRFINVQEAGTGKTHTFIDPAEFFKKYSPIYRQAYILEKGPSTIQNVPACDHNRQPSLVFGTRIVVGELTYLKTVQSAERLHSSQPWLWLKDTSPRATSS